MPLLAVNRHRVYYRLDGADAAPVLVLSHSLGQDHSMWDLQTAALSNHMRVLRYDIRGHGASDVASGDYRIDELGADVLALADRLGVDRFAFCGLSLGGMVGQWLAVNAADRLTALVLANTSPKPEAERMEARRRAVLSDGMASVADAVMGRFFSPDTLSRNPPVVAAARRTLIATSPDGYAGCCAAVRDIDLVDALRRISAPTLIIDGTRDVSLPWAGHGDRLADGIPHARIVHLRAAHLSNLEAPRSFTAAAMAFLVPRHEAADAHRAGLSVRRSVLGDTYVDRALTSPASADFQDLITRYAWGTIWTRPLLDIATRRLLVLAMSAAIGRWEEFRLHVRTGLDHELEWGDLEEVLLQVAIYAGVPAANTAFHIAAEERDRAADHP